MSMIFLEQYVDGYVGFFSWDGTTLTSLISSNGIQKFECLLVRTALDMLRLPDGKIIISLPTSVIIDTNNNSTNIPQTIAICWDPANSTWTFITSPSELYSNVRVTYYDNHLYFMTNNIDGNFFVRYNISHGSFTTLASPPYPYITANDCRKLLVNGSKIYMSFDDDMVPQPFYYEIMTNTYHRLNSPPGEESYIFGGEILDLIFDSSGQLYLGGNFEFIENNARVLNVNYIVKYANNDYQQLKDSNNNVINSQSLRDLHFINNKLYLITWSFVSSLFWNPSTQSWTSLNFPETLDSAKIDVFDNKMWACGHGQGFNGFTTRYWDGITWTTPSIFENKTFLKNNLASRNDVISITQTISNFENINKLLSDSSFVLDATTNATGASLTYTSLNPSVASIINNNTVQINSIGTASLKVVAGAIGFYTQTEKTITLTVSKPSQTITFNNLNKLTTDSTFNLNDLVSTNATGATFTYTSSDTSVAQIINGNQVQINGAGVTTLTATGSETTNYAQTQKTATLTVSKASQTITFNNLNKLTTDSTFNLNDLVSTNATGATFTYTSSDTSVAQIINGNQVQINGAGVTTLTATGSETDDYSETQKTATLTVTALSESSVSLPGWKRSKLNLYDFATKSLHLEIHQQDSSIQFEFPTNLTFTDATRNIEDVLDYLQRMDGNVDDRIQVLTEELTTSESYIDALEVRTDTNEADINTLEGRAEVNESDLVVLDERADSNASRLLADDAQLDMIESDIDALEARADANESDIHTLEGRVELNESDLVVLDERADSNASRLLVDEAQLDVVESDIDALEGRMDSNEADIDALEGRVDVMESDLFVLKNRADSNASRLLADDAQLDVVESNIDSLETRMSTAEGDIVDLENSFTVYEAEIEDVKSTLYAISDGNIESMLSSLQQITDSFDNNTNAAEDMAELNSRLTELISVIQELTETV